MQKNVQQKLVNIWRPIIISVNLQLHEKAMDEPNTDGFFFLKLAYPAL